MTSRAARSRAEATDELLIGPIAGELLGAEHLAARARSVARSQRLSPTPFALRPARLLARLSETRRILADAQVRLGEAVAAGADAGPAADWLLDNYYIIQEHLREVRAALPRGYYRELPELSAGPLTGYPRVYEIAIALISHSEARLDHENTDLFVDAFQSVTPLSIGELWAIPAMLRIGLIESVRRMTLRTLQRLDENELVALWSERVITASASGGADLRDALRSFAEAHHHLTPYFVSRFLHSLRQAEGASAPTAWLQQWMRDAGADPEQAVRQSTHRVTLTQIVMGNSITSLRDIGQRDWRVFVEAHSELERVLHSDPSGDYPTMTFATRDAYRHVVERIARQTRHRQVSVAQWAIDLAARPHETTPRTTAAVQSHVGYWLVDDGVTELERVAGYVPTAAETLSRAVHARPARAFVAGLAALSVAATGAVLLLVEPMARRHVWLVLLFAFLPALHIAVSLLNQLITTLMHPQQLPRLDLHTHGLTAAHRTSVVIPTLFGDLDDVRDALANVEVQFLANRERYLQFAILSDFTDSPTATTPGDDAIVAAAREGIQRLNDRHTSAWTPSPFHLLHRARRWNPQEAVWMGWERKRGKLAEFNRLVQQHGDAAFAVIVGETAALHGIRYVITLDADTVLPPDSVPGLVGAMAHPLNRPVYDPMRKRVVRGFGILQPRVGVSLPSAYRSRFASIASEHPGVDPYTTAVSDVYQDLFGEGSFTGKGIYDVDAFQTATHGRFPENALLSHDLIEGNYARAGLASDVTVFDDYPSTYLSFTRRKHRWIRGDWQLLPWLRHLVPGPDGEERNRLSILSRWKIIDNLRRSTVELSQLLFLLAGWTLLPGSALRWTVLGLAAIAAPWGIALTIALLRPPRDKSWRSYYRAVAGDAVSSSTQVAVAVLTLPHQALTSVDAIVRTLTRVFVTHRSMLEWQSALLVERSVADMPAQTRRAMRSTTGLLVACTIVLAASVYSEALGSGLAVPSVMARHAAAAILLGLWLLTPFVMITLSRSVPYPRRTLSATDRTEALRYAELHWRYFDTFVTEHTHWLAPDNVQASPTAETAMRTSPTNIGLQLMATVSACDLGFITVEDMARRLTLTFQTLRSMRRYRGHFFNWYDLTTLDLLEPHYISTVDSGNLAGHLIAIRQACLEYALRHAEHREALQALAEDAYTLQTAIDFSFLYDSTRKLFSIGFSPETQALDNSFYDLLASEARLASFVAIARNQAPVEHWLRLSRGLSRTAGATALVSWSGSMFEYLMPSLVMQSLPQTLLHETYRGAVDRHIAYARDLGVPWGISESAYNVRDRHLTYQYRAFGIPDLALKRGLGRELVLAPYASALALQVEPERAMRNLRALEALGALGEYGFCDALDYTRPERGARFALVETYMAHHGGMSLVAFDNALRDDVWQRRFHNDPLVKSAALLLHEQVPRRVALQLPLDADPEHVPQVVESTDNVRRDVTASAASKPRVALLGTKPYTVMLNHTGSGYSQYGGLAVTRWRADGTLDSVGQFCYIRDLTAGRAWSATRQPIGDPGDDSTAQLFSDRVTFTRHDGDVQTRMEVTVVSADAAEVRSVTLTNTGRDAHDLELTSYAEIAMNTQAADLAHPAFSNLFVETEWHAWCSALTATRRPRSPDDVALWCVHVLDAGRDQIGTVSCETDRARFIGRGRSVRNPRAMDQAAALSGTVGPVLDPVFAIRTRVHLLPGQSTTVAFTTLVATTRAQAFELAGRYHDVHAAQRALDFAWTSTQVELRELGVTSADAAVFQDLATQLVYAGGSLAPPQDELRRSHGSQPVLWAHGISGDNPIVVATIDTIAGLPTLRELLKAHRYWSHRGLTIDLVVINAHSYDYLQELRDGIAEAMILEGDTQQDRSGAVFVRRRESFGADDLLMLSATARVQIPCDGRSLSRIVSAADSARDGFDGEAPSLTQSRDRATPAPVATIERATPFASLVSALRPLVTPLLARPTEQMMPTPDLMSERSSLRFHNGIGGLSPADEYELTVSASSVTPAPWSNVIANPHGGFLVSERGAGCVWAGSAHFFRLTPWHNDPVCDPITDVIYLQDEESGKLWAATPAPMDGAAAFKVRHRAGSSTFDHITDGIQSELQVSLPAHSAVKVSLLRLTNHSRTTRSLTVTAFAEWTLGVHRDVTQYQVRTAYVAERNAIFARNHFDPLFSEWAAFLAVSEPVRSYSGDRLTFVGRNGQLAAPAALERRGLDRNVGVGLDPCAALQFGITLAPGESRDVTVLLGAGSSLREASAIIAQLTRPDLARVAVADACTGWDQRLGTIQVSTPDAAFDALLNKWSLYQTLSSRMWGRMGLYQSSGAYGFRDQLQDSMALVYAEAGLTRAHILRAAARQFLEGDVQHWWHPHSGRGVRTRFSDDLVWLPYVVDHYVAVTGDASVFDEYVPFLSMRELLPDEHEAYDLPLVTEEHGSVYEHCVRALRRACTSGPHGLPLMGTGDWNDGMSRVGPQGRGESVWLAWFLITTLTAFARQADARGQTEDARVMRSASSGYLAAVEEHGWDGAWYRRAFHDDGTIIGSASNVECQIDSIAQSWSVISGAGRPGRQESAMRAVYDRLVDEDERLIVLLAPPFDGKTPDPGYIRGYLPGIRENGGQYTHAALWVVLATALQGDGDRAFHQFQMLNPLTHSANSADVARYKVEPYVVAADVYTSPSHRGRGGWTWYTGSASWTYRVGLETLLGFTKLGDTLQIHPCVPASWTEYSITYRFRRTTYRITVHSPADVRRGGGVMTLDGVTLESPILALVDDAVEHVVAVRPRAAASSAGRGA